MMKLLMTVMCCLALVACGGDIDPEKGGGGNNGGGNNGAGNNGAGNNGAGNNGAGNNGAGNNGAGNNGAGNNGTDASCADACTVLVSNACDDITQSECETTCAELFTQPLTNCVAEATSCNEAEECIANPPTNNGGGSCSNVALDVGDLGDGTEQKRAGESCFFPRECLSSRCVTESDDDGDTLRTWCAQKNNCNDPQNADEECPTGYYCSMVSRDEIDAQPTPICVPNDVSAICTSEF